MSRNAIRSRWRLILVLVAALCVLSTGALYTHALLSDQETVEVTISGTTTLTTPASFTSAIAAVTAAPVGSQPVADELPGIAPGG
jgi:predicted ribosomally synthesized peptide with SipW-like signal peptide